MRYQAPKSSRKPPVPPANIRRYPGWRRPKGQDKRLALFPMALLGFVVVVATTLILVVIIRGPDTHASLWNEVRDGYVRTDIGFVASVPGPTLSPTPTPTPTPAPTATPAPTPTPLPTPTLRPGETPAPTPTPAPTLPPSPTAPPTVAATPTPRQISFSQDVLPVFRNNCAACHGATISLKGVNLTSYQTVAAGGADGPLFEPGKPEDSLLVNVLRGKGDNMRMPPTGALPEEQVKNIETWIEQGGQNN